MKIVDWFDFPPGHFACSPQFIPKSTDDCPKDQDPSTHGYIACVVLSDTRDRNCGTIDATPQDEFWIFDASNFGNRIDGSNEQATVYKLTRSPSLNLGFMIHSIWLSPDDFVQKSQPYSDVKVRQNLRRDAFWRDYGALVNDENNGQTLIDKPRAFKRMDDTTKNLFQEIQEPFIQQQLECSCADSHSQPSHEKKML